MKRPNIEIAVRPVVDANGSIRCTRADIRAVAAYLQAMSEETVEGMVTIGRLVVTIFVGRCLLCDGQGKKYVGNGWEPCGPCSGTGREPDRDSRS